MLAAFVGASFDRDLDHSHLEILGIISAGEVHFERILSVWRKYTALKDAEGVITETHHDFL